MTDSLAALLDEARHAAVARNELQHVYYDPALDGGDFIGVVSDLPRYWMNVPYVMTTQAYDWIAYPSGLVIPASHVNWFWEYEDEVRQGTALQAYRYALRKGIDPNTVWPVPENRVHGTYIRYEGKREDGRDYRLVHARAFPSWTHRP